MQTTIDLREEDARMLTRLGEHENLSSKELIEKVVSEYVRLRMPGAPSPAFGIWKDTPLDGLEYQSRLRDEWPD